VHKHHAVKMYEAVEVVLHTFLSTTFDGDMWSDSRLDGPQRRSGRGNQVASAGNRTPLVQPVTTLLKELFIGK
jgi:hypothetical protein